MAMNDQEIGVLLTATNQVSPVVQQAAKDTQQAMGDMQRTVKTAAAQMLEDINTYNAGFGRNIKTLEQVGFAQDALTRLNERGILTTQEYAKAASDLALSHAKIVTAAERAGRAVQQAGHAANDTAGFFQRMGNNARVMSEMSTLATEAMAGRFGQMRRSAFALLNQTGLLRGVFTETGAAIAGTVAVVAGLAAAAIEGQANLDQLNRTMAMTGNATRLTSDEVLAMAHNLDSGDTSFRNARAGLEALAGTGELTGQQLEVAGRAARDMAELTDQSMEEVSGAISKLAQDPVRALAELNRHFHLVTKAQFDQVVALEDAGDHYGALNLALKLTEEGLERNKQKWEESKSPMRQFWEACIRFLSDFIQKLEYWLDGEAIVHYWHKGLDALNDYIRVYNNLAARAGAQGAMIPEFTYKKGDDKSKGDREAQARQEQEQARAIDEEAKDHKRNNDQERADMDRRRFDQEVLDHKLSLNQQRIYWETIRNADKAGVREKEQAVQELLRIRREQEAADNKANRHEEAEAKKLAREKAKAAKEAARDQMQSLADQRATMEVGSKEILAIDQQMIDKAAELYKKGSREWHQMLQQMERDTAAFEKKQLAAKRAELQGAYDAARQERAAKAEEYERQFQDGQMTAERLRQVQQKLVQDQLKADRAYYAAKKKLEGGDVAEIAKDDAAILKLEKKAYKDLEKIDTEYHKHVRQRWAETAKYISRTMGDTIGNMIQGWHGWHDAAVSLMGDAAQRFIKYEEQKLTDWLVKKLTMKTTDEATEAATTETAIAASAMRAGAAGVASFAAAPWPVDMGAPAFGAQMAMTAAAYSAEGGWDRVPYDGAVTELHKDEMVLPRKVANPLRDMVSGKQGGGGGDHFHIHALDARSVKDVLRRHPAALASGMKKAARNGHFIGTKKN